MAPRTRHAQHQQVVLHLSYAPYCSGLLLIQPVAMLLQVPAEQKVYTQLAACNRMAVFSIKDKHRFSVSHRRANKVVFASIRVVHLHLQMHQPWCIACKHIQQTQAPSSPLSSSPPHLHTGTTSAATASSPIHTATCTSSPAATAANATCWRLLINH